MLPDPLLDEALSRSCCRRGGSPERLADALAPLLGDTEARRAQLAAFGRLDDLMALPGGDAPSRRAAQVILDVVAAPQSS